MKLKIGIVCYPTVGGSGVIATELGKMLAQKGHEVHFISSSVPYRLGQMYTNIFFHEVEVNQYAVFKYPPYDLTLASKLAEIAKQEGLDILHAHYAVPHAVCAYLAREMAGGLKVVTTLHGTDITVLGYDPSLTEIIRFGIEQSDSVTAVSDHLIRQTRELIGTDKPIATTYNFINEDEYFPRENAHLKQELGIDEDEKVIVHISNFRAVKRVDDIVKVFANIRERMPAKLLLIGDGPQKRVTCRLVNELGLKNDVLFLGNQNSVADLLSVSDLKLLLSEKESFGLVLLEAMACGVPAIGTKVGGIPEVILDGETGFLCEIGNIDEITSRAVEILEDDALHASMSEKAIERVHRHFHSQKILEQYENIYFQTLSGIETACRN